MSAAQKLARSPGGACVAASALVVALMASSADPVPRQLVRVRFWMPAAAAAHVAGAAPLFGDVDDVRAHAFAGAPDLTSWWYVDTDAPAAVARALARRRRRRRLA